MKFHLKYIKKLGDKLRTGSRVFLQFTLLVKSTFSEIYYRKTERKFHCLRLFNPGKL